MPKYRDWKDAVESVGSPSPRRYTSPCTTPSSSGPGAAMKSWVLKRYVEVQPASAADEVTSFWLEAGRRSTSGRSW